LSPQEIHYQEAMLVGVLGLVVNLVCAFLLGQAQHDHDHNHGHHHHNHHHHQSAHGHNQQHHDLNLKSAYLHVIADAATSVLAIVALAGGWVYGWSWLDPVTGLLGAVLVAIWSKDLIVQTGKVLLDREMDHPVVDEIRQAVEADQSQGRTRITDLHVWRVGKKVYSCALTVVTQDAQLTAAEVRNRISVHEEVVHATIEIHHQV
jgi:cation diffusion facilitator family transporter